MLPILPFVIGGVAGVVAGILAKNYYKENQDDISEKIRDTCMKADGWLCKKIDKLHGDDVEEDKTI